MQFCSYKLFALFFMFAPSLASFTDFVRVISLYLLAFFLLSSTSFLPSLRIVGILAGVFLFSCCCCCFFLLMPFPSRCVVLFPFLLPVHVPIFPQLILFFNYFYIAIVVFFFHFTTLYTHGIKLHVVPLAFSVCYGGLFAF